MLRPTPIPAFISSATTALSSLHTIQATNQQLHRNVSTLSQSSFTSACIFKRIQSQSQPHRSTLRSSFRSVKSKPVSTPKASVNDVGPTHIVTLITNDPVLSMSYVESLHTIASANGGEILAFEPLSDRAMQASLKYKKDLNTLREQFTDFIEQEKENQVIDIIIQPFGLFQSDKKLAVFDLDSTLIQQETIDELAAQLNLQKEVSFITEQAMRGELDFKEALEQRVKLLKGLSINELDRVIERVVITDGAKQLLKVLNKLNCKTALISGGFEFLAFHIQKTLNMDYAFANNLQVDVGNELLTGLTKGDIVDGEFKKSKLLQLAKLHGIEDMKHVMACGDGANDLPMLTTAGLGIAFNAKPAVQQKMNVRINTRSLYNVLYVLGLSDEQIETLLED